MKAWQVKLFIIAVVALGLFLLGRWSKKTVENIVTVGSRNTFTQVFRDMTKPKFPYLILIPQEKRVDSFTVYEDTPFGEIPVICETRCFPVPVFVNDKNKSYEGDLSVWVQGIIDSIVVNIPEKRISLLTTKDNLNWYAELNIWIDHNLKLSTDVEGGLRIKERIGIKVKAEAEQTEYYNPQTHEIENNIDGKLKAGISVGI